ncbi:MAG: AAA family ATPase [Terriglobales bacterium]
MRKWMRERIKRRKKEPEKAGAESTPAPLQPAFYDTEPTREEPRAEESHSTPSAAEPETSEPEAMPARSSPSVPAPGSQVRVGIGDAPRRRRKRGRGGRGRGGMGGQRMPVPPIVPEATSAVPVEAKFPPAEATGPDESAGASTVAVSGATPRPPRGTVVLAIGLPGSGKSSWFKRHKITPLSSDMLRALLFDDPGEQRFQDLVFSNLRSMLKARLIARRPMNYVDATNLTSHDRHAWVKLAKDYGYEVQAVFFDVPVEVCLERNQRRERVVSEDVMRRMAGKLRPPAFEEGFSKITVVRVKAKE